MVGPPRRISAPSSGAAPAGPGPRSMDLQFTYVGSGTVIANSVRPTSSQETRVAIPRAPQSPPVRPSHARSICNCGQSFSRAADYSRHLQVVHQQGNLRYCCIDLECDYTTRRKDKMLEHCRNMHGYPAGNKLDGFFMVHIPPLDVCPQ